MINNVTLVGRLTKDPELRRTTNGYANVTFTLAVDRKPVKGQETKADFVPCTCWNEMAENVNKYVFKGSLVGIVGKIQTRTYDDSTGKKQYVTEVLCTEIRFMDTRKKEEKPEVKEEQKFEVTSDDLPF